MRVGTALDEDLARVVASWDIGNISSMNSEQLQTLLINNKKLGIKGMSDLADKHNTQLL